MHWIDDVEYVDSKDKQVHQMNAEIQKLIDKRKGVLPPTIHYQRPGGNYRVVLRYGYKNWEELNFTQVGVSLAARRRQGLTVQAAKTPAKD